LAALWRRVCECLEPAPLSQGERRWPRPRIVAIELDVGQGPPVRKRSPIIGGSILSTCYGRVQELARTRPKPHPEPVSAKPQLVSRPTAPEFRILKIHRAEIRRGIRGLRSESLEIPRRRPDPRSLTCGNVGASVSTRDPHGETSLAGWVARIRTWKWRNQSS
jgi:hypothetical protein